MRARTGHQQIFEAKASYSISVKITVVSDYYSQNIITNKMHVSYLNQLSFYRIQCTREYCSTDAEKEMRDDDNRSDELLYKTSNLFVYHQTCIYQVKVQLSLLGHLSKHFR